MRGLDLRKFKKVLVEKDATHLEHPSGHKIIISHKLMGPDMKRQLDSLKMYGGGEVPATDDDTKKSLEHAFKKPEPKPTPPQSAEDKYEAIRKQNRANFGYAEGGQVPASPPIDKDKAKQVSDSFKKVFADGGEVKGEAQTIPASQLEADYTAENAIAQGDSPQAAEGQNWADQIGNEIPNEDPNAPIPPAQDMSHAHLSEALKNLSSKFVQSAPAPVQAQQPVPEQPQAQPMEQPAPQQVMDPGKPQGNFVQQNNQDVGLENRAQQATAQNTQQSLDQTAQIQGQEAKGMQELHQKYQQIGDQIHQKYEDLASQVEKGHIDPNQWFSSKSTGSQVATAIGMLFAGAAQGAGGHPELASKAIDDAINRDIDAQKSDLSNKQSLLGKYMEMYNSLPQAEAAARLTMHAATEGLVAQQAAKLGSQNAMNAATIWAAGNRRTALGQADNLAKGQAMSQMYGQMGQRGSAPSGSEAAHQKQLQDLAILNPERYKIEEQKYIPGVGIAAKPLPEQVHQKLVAGRDLSEKLAALESFARKNSGTFDPKTVAQGKVMAADAQSAIRVAQDQGVFKPSDQHFIESMIASDPTAFFSGYRTIPKYQTVRKLNDQTINMYQKAYGVKPFQDQQPSQPQIAVNKKTGERLINQNGKWVPYNGQ